MKNNGDVDLTGISVKDPMITLTGPTGDRINPGVLNPGETWVYTGDYEVTQADIDGSGFVENTVLHQLDQKIIYPHYDFKHLTEKYFEIGMKLDDFLIQLVKY